MRAARYLKGGAARRIATGPSRQTPNRSRRLRRELCAASDRAAAVFAEFGPEPRKRGTGTISSAPRLGRCAQWTWCRGYSKTPM